MFRVMTTKDTFNIIFFYDLCSFFLIISKFDPGESFNLAVVSTTGGDDKPVKCPMLFREAIAALLNKVDLIPYTNFSFNSFRSDLKKINSQIPLFEVSCTRGDGLKEWYKWISEKLN